MLDISVVTMAALFGNSSDGRNEPRSLVEFRAGKMKLTGSTVTADTRKGLVYMKQEDRLMHFYWKDRKNGEVVDVSMDIYFNSGSTVSVCFN